MNLFDQHETLRNSYEKLCDIEDNIHFLIIVSLVSMLNKKFYSPVAFIVEYINNKWLQQLVEDTTGYNFYEFIILFLRNFPNVAKSRKLKRIIDDKNEERNQTVSNG